MRYTVLWVLLFCLLSNTRIVGQTFFVPELQHPRNATVRKEIDEQKPNVNNTSDITLQIAREFKRRDSTYYVPWMLEGIFLKERAADKLGFENATVILEKAYALLTKDYSSALKKRTSDFFEYYPIYNLHMEFATIVRNLVDCYSNTDKPDSAFNLAAQYSKYNLQNEGSFMGFDARAWLVHRNRFYTSKQYSFLKNSIEENELLAHAYLDSSLVKIKKDKVLNDNFFQPGYEKYLLYSVYHYKAILFGYNLQIDSALACYDWMKKADYFSDNNYANLQMIRGNFRLAYDHYHLAKNEYTSEKQLQEWAYFTSMLDIFKHDIPQSVQGIQEMIKKVGSTPGFGWYNLALARALNYGGNVDDVNRIYNKAANFKEVHIGTTFGQTHYDIALAMVNYHKLKNQLTWQQFSDKNWWYKPTKLFSIARVWFKSLIQKYKIITLLKNNPEREQVIYKLFSTESTVSWDEILRSIDGFSNNYFLDYFKKQEQKDERNLIRSYYKYAQAQLLYNKGDYTQAAALITELKETIVSLEFEVLFRARILALDIAIQKELHEDKEIIQQATLELYYLYPEIFPFLGLKLPVVLKGEVSKSLKKSLEHHNIDWQSTANELLPSMSVALEGSEYVVSINENSPYLEARRVIAFEKNTTDDKDAKEMVQALFHIIKLTQ